MGKVLTALARMMEQSALCRDRFRHRLLRQGNELFRRPQQPSHPQFGALWQLHPRYFYNEGHAGLESDVHSLVQNDSAAFRGNADAAPWFHGDRRLCADIVQAGLKRYAAGLEK